MPLGEDVPMLVPISIVLTVMVLFLIGVFMNMAEQNQIVRMSQMSLDTMNYLTNVVFADEFGNLDYDKLGTGWGCQSLDDLNITVNYRMKINVSDSANNRWWCWENNNFKNSKTTITNAVPVIILNNEKTDLGKVSVSVSK